MDSPPEAAFDALVELARDLLGGTKALVSLVDDQRQFFKAQVGLGEPWASDRETPLSLSFCQHVVTASAPLLVTDARTDARVKDSRAIEELGVIAYAGVPLVDEDAHTLGALCVIDGQPREWTEKELRTLKALAKAVMAEVHLHQYHVQRQREAHERELLLHSLQATQTALHHALARTRQVVEAVGAGIWELDVATGKVEADARTKDLMGLPRDDSMTLNSGLNLIDAQQSARVAAASAAALRGENGGSYHIEFRTGGGNGPPVRWVESRAQAFFDTGGKATHLAGVNLDITSRKAAEAEREKLMHQLRASEAQLRLVMDALPLLVSFVTAEERYGVVNKAYEEWFGISEEQMRGRPVREIIGEAAYAVLGPYVRRGLAGESFSFEQQGVPYRLGGTRDVKVSFMSLREADGRVSGYVAMLQDITPLRRLERERDLLERKETAARAEAEAARARLAKFVESAPAALGSVRGPHHVFEMVNPRYQELMGRHRQLLGRPMAEAAPEVVAQGFIQLFDTVYRTGEPFLAEGIPAKLDRQGDGTLEDVFFNLTFQPVRDLQGQVEGVDIFGFDVTSQVRLRQREEEFKRLAEERTALEQQLIGIVSHDLRNPLAAILLGASTLTHNPTLNERGRKSVLRVSSAAERASRMVNDLLDFTQARLGRGIPIHPRPLHLAETLESWVEEARAAFPERTVNLHVQGVGPASVDPDRMAQVVGNLVSNALKYSPADSPVEVRLREEPGALVLEVHNTGAPIPEAQRARLFHPLERGQGQRDMSSRSVGLGLFIVKHVVDAHGGHISVTSTPEAGTTFSVRLPLASPGPGPASGH